MREVPRVAGPSRRQLLQGIAGATVLGGIVRGQAAAAADAVVPTDARPDVVHRGRALAVTPDARQVVLAHAARPTLAVVTRRTQARRIVTLGGHPLELAISPDGALVAVTTASWQTPGLELVSLRPGGRQLRFDAGPAPFAPVFTGDRRHLLVTGGEQDGTLRIMRAPDFAAPRIIALGRVPRGIAVTPDDRAAWVALHAEDALVRVDLHSGTVTRRLAVPVLPERLALSPSGRRLLVSHGGHWSHTVSEVDTRSGHVITREVGGAATAVAYGRGGNRLAALLAEDAIVVIDRHGHRRLRPTVAGPRGLAIAGRHAFTVSSVDATIGRVAA